MGAETLISRDALRLGGDVSEMLAPVARSRAAGWKAIRIGTQPASGVPGTLAVGAPLSIW